ncbi:DNA-binding protein WhiA [Parvimonas sp. D2]|uniref:DNA-binding protein WhiA n=1 Tax=unclassified Parvimonas TaxID=1151464 RepID=UPI001CB434F4|nr:MULTISPECIES: DNA-binding protein WhiA [unclassified Parvimonas]MBF1300549.1 DNA-binding protein WhiA [Parvimonas sp.]MEB3012122.1 DNA-binding protein WhiA [Parvimonas sp. D2]MEB3087445.1 DNA-binding protein WhiA [Parvimonas sp. D4]
MAFSTDLKNELSRREIVEKDSAISELSAFIRTNGTIVFSNFAFIIRFETTNNSIIRRIFKLFKFLYSYDGKIMVSKISNLRKNNVYKIVIEDEEISKRFLQDTFFSDLDSLFLKDDLYEDSAKSKNFIKNFLCGIFLGAGSIANPDKSYHLEFTLNSNELAKLVIKYLKLFGIKAKSIEKKDQYIVYVKDSTMISDFLSLIGTVNSLFKFEETKMIKEIKNNTNRLTNCETANFDKTLNTAFAQIDAINKVYKIYGKKNLDKNLLELCELRLKNPTLSLKELAEILKISKSGVNHRFKKIMDMANKI